MSLREQQRTATREQIIDAVHAVLTEEHPASLSMPRVAARAGTSLRTVYRYFPTKEALVDAASESFRVPVGAEVGRVGGVAGLEAYLRLAWKGFTASLPAVRAQHLTPAGRALRDARTPRNRRAIRRVLLGEGLDLPTRELDRLVDLVVAITSSAMYLELVDRFGHEDEDAAGMAAWAVAAVVDKARREGEITT